MFSSFIYFSQQTYEINGVNNLAPLRLSELSSFTFQWSSCDGTHISLFLVPIVSLLTSRAFK